MNQPLKKDIPLLHPSVQGQGNAGFAKESNGHPLAFEEAPRGIIAKLRQQASFFMQSGSGRTVQVGFLAFVLLTAVLCARFFVGNPANENGISLQNIFAPSVLEVVDAFETQRRVEEVRQNVPLQFRPETPVNLQIIDRQALLMTSFEEIANSAMSMAQKKARYAKLVAPSPEADWAFSRLFKQQTSSETWLRLRMLVQVTTDKLLKKGVTPQAFFDNKKSLIEKALPASVRGSDRDLVTFLVAEKLQPNRVVDERAMMTARHTAEREVQPVIHTYQKGEKIVGKGEVIGPLQQEALRMLGKGSGGFDWRACLGMAMLAGFFVFTLWGYLFTFQKAEFFKPAYAGLFTLLSVLVVSTFQVLFLSADITGDTISSPLLWLPLGAFALTLTIFSHPRTASFATVLLAFLLMTTVKGHFYELATLLAGSLSGILILSWQGYLSNRNRLIQAGLLMSLVHVFILVALHLLGSTLETQVSAKTFLLNLGLGSVNGLVCAVATLGILPLLESLFQLITPYTLMELANHDQPLLRRMQFEAPGTFHHSLMVASLSEAAAEAVDANVMLTRVGCLYHDIGKMKRPLFFIENQAYFGVENPHDKLSPRLSKMVITAHPRDSLEMARQYRLPEVIKKFMTEHHGTLVAGYFYNKACQQEGAENVVKDQFRYPGPKPNIRETAIVMLADACESAVRAMKTPTATQIEERIEKIFRERIEDGQFDDCPITFRDLHLIQDTFTRVLRGIRHQRIEYQQFMVQELKRKIPGIDTTAAHPPVPTDISAFQRGPEEGCDC